VNSVTFRKALDLAGSDPDESQEGCLHFLNPIQPLSGEVESNAKRLAS
jgi:hypothetical protein